MNGYDARGKYRVIQLGRSALTIPAAVLVVVAVIATAACENNKPSVRLSVKSGFDPCRNIPSSALTRWNADSGPKPAPSSESDGSTSHDPELKSCEYDGKSDGSEQGLTSGDSLYVGLTRESFDSFHREYARDEPYRNTEIGGRKMEIKGPYSTAHIPGRYTTCDIYVQMNGGGLLLTSVKVGDACQMLTDVAQTVVPLLPAGS